jgi:proteic killer suppression protein
MEITFDNQKLQNLCEQPALAQRKLGKSCSKKLQSRLADLMAARACHQLRHLTFVDNYVVQVELR